jgi:DNA replication and repair protein RecF
VQTFLTTTSLENVKKDIIATPKVFNVTDGLVVTETTAAQTD